MEEKLLTVYHIHRILKLIYTEQYVYDKLVKKQIEFSVIMTQPPQSPQ